MSVLPVAACSYPHHLMRLLPPPLLMSLLLSSAIRKWRFRPCQKDSNLRTNPGKERQLIMMRRERVFMSKEVFLAWHDAFWVYKSKCYFFHWRGEMWPIAVQSVEKIKVSIKWTFPLLQLTKLEGTELAFAESFSRGFLGSWLLSLYPFRFAYASRYFFFKSLLVSLFLSRQCIAAHQPFLLGVWHTPLDLYGLCT